MQMEKGKDFPMGSPMQMEIDSDSPTVILMDFHSDLRMDFHSVNLPMKDLH